MTVNIDPPPRDDRPLAHKMAHGGQVRLPGSATSQPRQTEPPIPPPASGSRPEDPERWEQQLKRAAVAWHSATVIDETQPALKQTTSGPPKVVAAWLRAVADQLDPQPKRPTMRGESSHDRLMSS